MMGIRNVGFIYATFVFSAIMYGCQNLSGLGGLGSDDLIGEYMDKKGRTRGLVVVI